MLRGSLKQSRSILGCASAYRNSSDYQYLQNSKIPTYHFQPSLRRLPVPAFEKSMERFLESAKVILPPEIYEETERKFIELDNGSGEELQDEVLRYDHIHKNSSYISDHWFEIYLRARTPVPVNYNPFMTYAPDPEERFNHQLTRATNFAISYARFKKSLDAEILAPEVFHLNPKKSDTEFFRNFCSALPSSCSWFGAALFKAFPLDMSQYKSLFNGSRVPRRIRDSLVLNGSHKHFIVLHKGRIFSVRIFDNEGNILPAREVQAALAAILKVGPIPEDEAVGSLTSLDRDTWADIHTELRSLGENDKLLQTIDYGMFALCLDDLKTQDHKRLVQSLLVGDKATNRWFDKCFQLIVDANGMATINFEHSWGDGVAVLRLMEESYKDTNKNHFVTPDDQPPQPSEGSFVELKFTLTDDLKSKISAAQQRHVKNNENLDFATVEYKNLNRDIIKKKKLSPDSVMQLAIQMAYYKLYKKFVATYESCSTAAFLKGRTECMRSATAATKEAVLAFESGNVANAMELLKKCSDKHSDLVTKASMGQGFDRHILALRIAGFRMRREIFDIFCDSGFETMNHFILSTSTLSTETIVFGGFGPVVEDGFGIGYNVVPSKLGAVITCRKNHNDAQAFATALTEALDQLAVHLKQ